TSWEDCSTSHELAIDWDDVRFTPVEPQAADLNGDGTADFLIAATTPNGSVTTLHEDLSSAPVGDTFNWIAAEFNGDSRKDWVYMRSTPAGPLIATLLSSPTGYLTAAQSPFPGTDRLTALRNWRVVDADGDGLDDLVYLTYLAAGEGIQVSTWFSNGD